MSAASDGKTRPRFAPGDAVRVRDTQRPGHVRTPGYCRGRRGVIERVCGSFPNPEELAYRLSGEPAKVLYRVRFAAAELWPEDTSPISHTVEIEIYEHWLEPA